MSTAQDIYDAVSRHAEATTPGPQTPEGRAWVERVRRLRWAEAWSFPGFGVVLPGLPGIPGGGGGTDGDDDSGDTVSQTDATDQSSESIARTETDGEDGSSDTVDPGPTDDGASDTTDPSGEIPGETKSTGMEAATSSQAAILAAKEGTLSAAPPAATITVSFGQEPGPLPTAWAALRETWSQAGGFAALAANPSGQAILAYTGIVPAAVHTSNVQRPTGVHGIFGAAACLSQNADGTHNGYACLCNVGGTVELFRIDSNVWTSLGSALAGGIIAGQYVAVQRNGGTVRAFVNGVARVTAADATYPTGWGGIAAAGTGNVTTQWVMS